MAFESSVMKSRNLVHNKFSAEGEILEHSQYLGTSQVSMQTIKGVQKGINKKL